MQITLQAPQHIEVADKMPDVGMAQWPQQMFQNCSVARISNNWPIKPPQYKHQRNHRLDDTTPIKPIKPIKPIHPIIFFTFHYSLLP